jgi:hypothetical protein
MHVAFVINLGALHSLLGSREDRVSEEVCSLILIIICTHVNHYSYVKPELTMQPDAPYFIVLTPHDFNHQVRG